MAEKPLKTDLAEFVDSVIFDPETGFAETVTVNGESMPAIVVTNYQEEQFDQAEIESSLTAITVASPALDVAGAAIGDPVVIGADSYTIKNRRDRNSGITRLVLFNA